MNENRGVSVFIHGLFKNPMIWTDWIDNSAGKGFFCHAPAYPYHNGEAFGRYVQPVSRNIHRNRPRIHFGKCGVSLLLAVAERDHIVPAVLNRGNHYALKAAGADSEYDEFAGRCHFICRQENWQEVAGRHGANNKILL